MIIISPRFFMTGAFSIFFALALNGCATITQGSSQAIIIETNPAGASCALSRHGNIIATINPTPGKVQVSKDKDTISVVCKKDRYFDGVGTLPAELQGMTFGNAIFGGVFGVLIDSGSGAMHKYQPLLSVLLIPQDFRSTSERDKYFESLKAECMAEHAKKISKIKESFDERDEDKKSFRLSEIGAADAAKEARLAEIEKMRTSAIVLN